MRPVEFDADLAVVGLGAMRASATSRPAERGLTIVGREPHHPGHALGSSQGKTCVLRVTRLEHPNLVLLTRRSRELQTAPGGNSGTPDVRGAVIIGHEVRELISGTSANPNRFLRGQDRALANRPRYDKARA